MNGKKLMKGMNYIDEKFVQEAEYGQMKKIRFQKAEPKKREKNMNAMKPVWIGCLAACLCLFVFAGIGMQQGALIGDAGGGIDGTVPGGMAPDGIDPVAASIAVFPLKESLANVKEATAVSIREEEAKSMEKLGRFLPESLPKGCRCSEVTHYETTMKDGTQYHMLRATYFFGAKNLTPSIREGEKTATESSLDTAFCWTVFGYKPDTKHPIYKPEEITVQFLENRNGFFVIDCGEVYIGIELLHIGAEDMLDVMDFLTD